MVFPTIAQESAGRTAVEAMAAGLPVVASRIGGLPLFTVADGADRAALRPGRPRRPGAGSWRCCSMTPSCVAPAMAGRRRFEEHYAWPVIVDRHYRPLLVPTRTRDRGSSMMTGAVHGSLEWPGRAGSGRPFTVPDAAYGFAVL